MSSFMLDGTPCQLVRCARGSPSSPTDQQTDASYDLFLSHIIYRVGFGDICPSHEMTDYGKAFIVLVSFAGLGMFCGPVLDLAGSWTTHVPGGMISLATVTIAIGVVLFTWLEDVSQSEAAYMSFIAGTTIGYVSLTFFFLLFREMLRLTAAHSHCQVR